MRWGRYIFALCILMGMWYALSFALALISMKSTLALLGGLTWVAYTICGLIVVGVMIELMRGK